MGIEVKLEKYLNNDTDKNIFNDSKRVVSLFRDIFPKSKNIKDLMWLEQNLIFLID